MLRKVCFFLTQKTATQHGICCEVKHFVLGNWYQYYAHVSYNA